MPKARLLIGTFVPTKYELAFIKDGQNYLGHLKVTGRKVGRPARRLTLHQKGLKILDAKIVKLGKHGKQQVLVLRINHHKLFEQVRLHADQLLYPGEYIIELTYAIPESGVEGLRKSLAPDRTQMPMIDEPAAKAEYVINSKEISQDGKN